MSQKQLASVGAFVVVGVLLFAVGIFMIGDRRMLFTEYFEVNADFGLVTGIQVGTLVRVAGVEAGEVLRIGLPSSPMGRFVVRMRVRDDLHPLVRTDSVAAVLTDGLLGNVFIQIRQGTDAAEIVESGGTLRGIDAIEVADLITEGRDTFRTLASEFIELRQDLGATVDILGETVQTTTLLVNDVGNDVRAISTMSALFMDQARALADDSRQIFDDLRAGRGTVGKLLTDDELYVRATGIAAEMEATLTAARGASENVEAMLSDFRAGGQSSRLWAEVSDVLGTAQNAMSDLAENTEALKHNWLVRGFFDDRGFFNLDAMTLAEYRELVRRDVYETLRIWVEAENLFSVSPDGVETLTESGRRRLDSAMGEFLRYPRNSPLVVEGYATAGQRGDQYRSSDYRADIVRDYLVDTFGRVTTLTGTMPVGSEAVGSPRGNDTWDGVALTLFVRPDAMPVPTTSAAGGQ